MDSTTSVAGGRNEALAQQIHSLKALAQVRNGVHVEIEAKAMPEFVHYQLQVDSCFT